MTSLYTFLKCFSANVNSGNIVNWTSANWKKINVEDYNEIFTSSLCQPRKLGSVLFPEKMEAPNFRKLCHQFNGKMFQVTNENTRDLAHQLLGTKIDECNGKESLFIVNAKVLLQNHIIMI